MKVASLGDNREAIALQLDDVTFRQLVDRYTAVLLAKAYRLLLDEEGAKDLVQDIFAELWEKKDTIVINSNVPAYLFGMLKHRFLRQASRINLHSKAMEHFANRMQEMEDSIVDAMHAAEINQTLADVLQTLPPYMQEIFILRDKDYSLKEIAKAMGLAEQTVKGYHSELRNRVKRGLLAQHPELSNYLLMVLVAQVIKP